jgi:hypothetical protein
MALSAPVRNRIMCDSCKAIDARIERYRYLSRWISDPQTLEAIKRLIEELETEKKSLHSGE